MSGKKNDNRRNIKTMTTAQEKKMLTPWIEEIPFGWKATRLDAVADIYFSNVDKLINEGETLIHLCNYVDVYKNEHITNALDFMEASADVREIRRFQIQRGDVLATKDSEDPNDIAIPSLVVDELPGILCGYHLAMIRPRFTNIVSEYLAWLHVSKQFRFQYEAKATGVTRFGLSQYAFRSARIPLPPLPEQQRIAAYLDMSCTEIDAAVSAKRKQLEALNKFYKQEMTRLMTKGIDRNCRTKPSGYDWLGEVPEHWMVHALKRLLSMPLEYGLNEAAELEEKTFPRYLRITDFDDDGNLREDTFRSLPWEIAKEALLEENDILFARSGATVGKTFIFRNYAEKACFAGYLIRARTLKHKLDPVFLYIYTKTIVYDVWKNLIFTQATIQNISALKYNYLPIPLPPLDEQKAIVKYLESEELKYQAVVVNLESQITTLIAYRKSLIHECVTGKRRITEKDLRNFSVRGSVTLS
jgi:type I restriction enzyme S subunit